MQGNARCYYIVPEIVPFDEGLEEDFLRLESNGLIGCLQDSLHFHRGFVIDRHCR